MFVFVRACLALTAYSSEDRFKLVDVKQTSRETTLCLAAAHALVRLDDGTIVGDPMEKTTLDALNWQVGKGEFSTFLLPCLSCNWKFCRRLCHVPSEAVYSYPQAVPVLIGIEKDVNYRQSI